MKPVRLHRPGTPSDPEPPDRLLKIADAVRDPLVIQSGVTTTAEGRWALYVTVPASATVPIAEVESQASGYPVVYEAEPKSPTRAGPAFPDQERRKRR